MEDALLDAAWQVLTEQGYLGFTYEALAARPGTSRPVLCRRWPQREDLLRATVTRFWRSTPIPLPDLGNLRGDAIEFSRNAKIGRVRMMTLLGVQIMEFCREDGSSFADLRNAVYLSGNTPPFEAMLAVRSTGRITARAPLCPGREPSVRSFPH